MSDFHLHLSDHRGNSEGRRTTVQQVAYNKRDQFKDLTTGDKTTNWRPDKDDVLWESMFFDPKRTPPDWAHDAEKFANEISRVDHRKNSIQGQGMIGAFPDGLTLDEMKHMLTDFMREKFSRHGYISHVAIHRPPVKSKIREGSPGDGGPKNYHFHAEWSKREIGPDGLGKALPPITPDQLCDIRQYWAELGARQYERKGRKLDATRHRVSHLTLDQQRKQAIRRGDFLWADVLDRRPTRHEGPEASAMRKNGFKTSKARYNDSVRETNEAIRQQNQKLRKKLGTSLYTMLLLQEIGEASVNPEIMERFKEELTILDNLRKGNRGTLDTEGKMPEQEQEQSRLSKFGNYLASQMPSVDGAERYMTQAIGGIFDAVMPGVTQGQAEQTVANPDKAMDVHIYANTLDATIGKETGDRNQDREAEDRAFDAAQREDREHDRDR